MKLLTAICLALACLFCWQIGEDCLGATVEQIADAIYKAEGGTKASKPYGIMLPLKDKSIANYRRVCINTISHAAKDWNGKGDFIDFLGARYCPVGCKNDNGTNKFWTRNVRYFLRVK
jgi:hypothetical protein